MYGLNVFLQSAECLALTKCMKLISDIITPVPLCVIAVIIFWSVNKRAGILTAMTVVLNVSVNSAVKLLFRVKRPFDVRSDIKKLDTTGGYSFPSGHAEQAAGMAYNFFRFSKRKKTALISGAAFTLLMMMSRMYLGMHSVLDVTVGAALGIALSYVTEKLYLKAESTGKWHILYAVTALSALFAVINSFDRDLVVMTGISLGAVTGFILEEKHVRYKVPKAFGKKVSASVIGLAVILAVKSLFLIADTEKIVWAFSEYTLFGLAITGAAPLIIQKILKEGTDNNEIK